MSFIGRGNELADAPSAHGARQVDAVDRCRRLHNPSPNALGGDQIRQHIPGVLGEIFSAKLNLPN